MSVFLHHIYEYKKGLRNLVLHTSSADEQEYIEKNLQKYNIPYTIKPVRGNKINTFFGHSDCVAIIESFGNKALNEYSDEEDYILGIMLGYDKLQQCRRYLERKRNIKVEELIG